MAECHDEPDVRELSPPDALPRREVERIVRDSERRLLIAVLEDLETPEHCSALVRNLAMHTGRSGEAAIRKLRYRLHHVHLPVLESLGLVDYSAYDRTLELTDAGRQLCAELARVERAR